MTQSTAENRTADFPQRADLEERRSGPNFSLGRIGKPENLMRYGVRHPSTRSTIPGKVFLHDPLDLTSMEISFGLIPAQTSIPFFHKHKQNEEVYLFIRGEGQFRVDDQIMEITEGTAIRVAPAGVRSCRNTSSQDMFYIVIQAKEGSLEQWTGTDGIGVPGEVTWPEAK